MCKISFNPRLLLRTGKRSTLHVLPIFLYLYSITPLYFYSHNIIFILFSSDKPDTVTFRSSSLIPRTGSQITLNCSSNGVPAPSYKFESITGTNTKILRDTKLGNYSIAQINYADYVEYRVTFRCTAYNTIGTALSKEVEVIIQGNISSFIY